MCLTESWPFDWISFMEPNALLTTLSGRHPTVGHLSAQLQAALPIHSIVGLEGQEDKMIAHRTFSGHKWLGLAPSDTQRKAEEVRQQAEDFIDGLDEKAIVSITESALGGNGPYIFSVTVWYTTH
jgi:hypothetical protein